MNYVIRIPKFWEKLTCLEEHCVTVSTSNYSTISENTLCQVAYCSTIFNINETSTKSLINNNGNNTNTNNNNNNNYKNIKSNNNNYNKIIILIILIEITIIMIIIKIVIIIIIIVIIIIILIITEKFYINILINIISHLSIQI